MRKTKTPWSWYCDCGKKKQYSEPYDAYFCASCDKWLESLCSDSTCIYCEGRPEKPSMVKP